MRRTFYCHRQGLTLTELLIVLTILAVMTTLAIQVTEGVIEQGRYDATIALQERVRDAILGPRDQGRTAAGFLADMGRLPVSVAELLTNPSSSVYTNQTFAHDLDGDTVTDVVVTLGSGWRGPYLLPGPGLTTVKDAWGNDLELMHSGPQLAIRSPKVPDLVVPAQDYSSGIIKLQILEENAEGTEVTPSLTSAGANPGNMPEPHDIELRIFRVQSQAGAEGEVNPVVEQVLTTDPAAPNYSPALRTAFAVDLLAQPIGRLAAVAVKRQHAPPGWVRRKSAVVYLTVAPRADVHKKLVLR
ncbi:MAG: prepilin-type N-terminal cleavage/methylation domain-containing protein [Gemmataceae bacterium]|nr:prepilin-type N-terminal cleavage/methylation domain-containing protein [Gemmataceae bacterium]MDW8267264.1 prepilin-type N-terminal cleavage/methylation domain-containing protein [Gemmataceae bacterium]